MLSLITLSALSLGHLAGFDPLATARVIGNSRSVIAVNSSTSPTYNVTRCPGYRLSGAKQTSTSLTAQLSLAGPACNAFGPDIQDLVLDVSYETQSRLRVHLYDKAKKQYQIPSSVLPSPGGSFSKDQSDLEFKYSSTPFAFWIVRKRTGDVIFDTRPENIPTYQSPIPMYTPASAQNTTAMPKHTLIFAPQYLQISSALPPSDSSSLYGLNEVYSGNYKIDVAEGAVRTAWALDIGDPVDQNMYGSHGVYQEVRAREGGAKEEVDSHAVFMKNSHGVDTILREGVVQYRAIGGTLDFYFYSGDDHSESKTENSAIAVIEQYVQSIGLPQVPPLWASGYHQCRWGYQNISMLQEVVDKMKEANIPMDVIWSDIDWMTTYRNFESQPNRFPPKQFKAFVNDLHSKHQHYIPIIDAAISVQVPNGTDVYKTASDGLNRDVFIKNSPSVLDSYRNSSTNVGNKTTFVETYVGLVWPGYTYFPDWFAKNTASWWTAQFRRMFDSIGEVDGIWLDMNEPSSFCTGSCGTGADWNKLPDSPIPIGETPGWPEGYDNVTYGRSGNMTVNGSSTYNPNLPPARLTSLTAAIYESTDKFLAERDMTSNSVKPATSQLHVRATASNSSGLNYDYPPYAIHNAYGRIDEKTVSTNASTAVGPLYNTKNIWGTQEEILTWNTLQELQPKKRPFLVSRSTFAGAGKYTHHWLGDNYSSFRYMALSIQGLLQFQLFGIPMVGPDTCGFAGNTDEELCARWMALSAWFPFYRSHNIINALSQEPYQWDSVAAVTRKVIAARYSLLPLWATLYAQSSSRGTPVVRTLWQEFPGQGYESVDRQFLVGTSLLVTPVLAPNVTTVKGVFPAAGGLWRDYWTYQKLNVTAGQNSTIPAPLSSIPVYIRPGSVLPTFSNPGSTVYDTSKSSYTLLASPNDKGEASGSMYYDDGETQWTRTPPGTFVSFTVKSGRMSSKVTKGSERVANKANRVVILGLSKSPKSVNVDGRGAKFTYNRTTQALNISTSTNLNSAFEITWS